MAIILSISIIIIIILLFILFKTLKRKTDLEKRYSPIIDLDVEKENIQKEIKALQIKQEKEEADYNKKKENIQKEINKEQALYNQKKEKYGLEFRKAEQLIQKMKKEIPSLEETMEIIDYGLYSPHFDFKASEEYKVKLKEIYDHASLLIKQDKAVVCSTEWTVEGSKTKGRQMTQKNHKLMLRAFNGECDSAVSKVRWNNVKKMEERIKKSYEAINKTGEINKSRITSEYLHIKLQELYATHEYQEKIQQEKEEQKRIQEQMREEEKARKEAEKAQKEAEKEEANYQKALEKAKEELSKASQEKVSALNDKIQALQEQLKAAQEKRERAISQAQLTKSGYIYVISNIGSSGENIFKIGMTRRLEPMDRIKELGDASVPFPFDVHAMIYSENAPELEAKLHKHFAEKSVNLVNMRKEFFAISINEIEAWARDTRSAFQVTKLAEAREYRETLAIKNKGKDEIKEKVKEAEEFTLAGVFSEE